MLRIMDSFYKVFGMQWKMCEKKQMQGENLDLGLQTVCTVSMSKEAANSAICASEREASSIASITSIGSRNPGERENSAQ